MKKGILTSILVATAASVVLLSGVLARVPQSTPESEGFSSERLARISVVLRDEIDKGTLPGAVTLIARHGKVVHFEAHGYLDSGKTRPMTQDAVFRLFSMAKPFVSVVAMMLVEQGRMKLSDPVATWIPEFKDMQVLIEKKDAAGNVIREPVPAERPITVQDLLRHTSGFAYANNTPFPEIKEAYTKADAARGHPARLAAWHALAVRRVDRRAGGPPGAPDRHAARPSA
jgi:CubicO group peptidase (beta-lactamase class C family)